MTNFELNKEFLNDPWITKLILQFILSDIIDTQNGIFESEKQVYEYLTNPVKNKSVEIFYELMSNKNIDSIFKWDFCFVTNDNRERVIKGIEKSVGRFFLYSIDENPEWEMQEKLMEIGKRYHLG